MKLSYQKKKKKKKNKKTKNKKNIFIYFKSQILLKYFFNFESYSFHLFNIQNYYLNALKNKVIIRKSINALWVSSRFYPFNGQQTLEFFQFEKSLPLSANGLKNHLRN